MRRIVTLALLILTVTAGSAMADRDRDRGHRGSRGGDRHGHYDRGHRHNNHRPVVRRDYRRDNYRPVRHHDYRYSDRRRVYVNNGYYRFNGGYRRAYTRPIIRHRYYDYRVRPTILFEQVDTVPGYVWVRGNWSWSGIEWIWTPGHYEVDVSYQYSEY